MDRIEGDVRETVRRRLVEVGGAAAYRDPAVFDAVWSSLGRAAGERNLNVLMLPELLDGIHDWEHPAQPERQVAALFEMVQTFVEFGFVSAYAIKVILPCAMRFDYSLRRKPWE